MKLLDKLFNWLKLYRKLRGGHWKLYPNGRMSSYWLRKHAENDEEDNCYN